MKYIRTKDGVIYDTKELIKKFKKDTIYIVERDI